MHRFYRVDATHVLKRSRHHTCTVSADKPRFHQLEDQQRLKRNPSTFRNGQFYNFCRPHGAHNGKTPKAALGEKLSSADEMSRE